MPYIIYYLICRQAPWLPSLLLSMQIFNTILLMKNVVYPCHCNPSNSFFSPEKMYIP